MCSRRGSRGDITMTNHAAKNAVSHSRRYTFHARKVYRREWLTAFFAAWFVIVMSPLLPLREHMDGSYLTVPLIGLAMWGAWGVVCGWRAGRSGKIAAVSLLAIYLCVSVPVARVVAV